MSGKKREDRSTTASDAEFDSPFAGLAGLRSELPEGEAPVVEAAAERAARPARVIVRRERKGRGGKTVTLIERAALDDDALRSLKKELGLGAHREDEVVVVHGDVVERVQAWLAAR